MRYLLIFWAMPLGIFWGWYFLSLNDINFGFLFLSRQVHDFAFDMYGNILGIEPAIIPGMVARACVMDSLFILALFAFRRRRQIMARFNAWKEARYASSSVVEPVPSDLSRSSTP